MAAKGKKTHTKTSAAIYYQRCKPLGRTKLIHGIFNQKANELSLSKALEGLTVYWNEIL